MPITLTPAAKNTIKLPLTGAEDARVQAYLDQDGQTHLAILIGKPETQKAPLTRLHSSCFTGDILGSLRCDCGDQLQAALKAMKDAGTGILLYLDQEGRGIGLFNKLKAYALQDGGMDTVEANHALGFEADERDFTVAAEILKLLKVNTITLLTNNPEKIKVLEQSGITITARAPLKCAHNPHNENYLNTKQQKLGHL